MPHSPFTRVIIFILIAGFALGLLYPSEYAQILGMSVLPALPILLLIFAWSAVRDAAPFDDRAFHRTLPPRAGQAFWTVARLYLLLLGCVSVFVTCYCAHYHFGWRPISYGIAAMTLPVLGYLAATSIAASAASFPEWAKIWNWLIVFGAPVSSVGLLNWIADDGNLWSSKREHVYFFGHLRLMIAAGATLYPLIWWLLAARGRRGLGLILAAWLGALMPWLFLYGDFAPVPSQSFADYLQLPPASDPSVRLERQAMPPQNGKGYAVDELLHISGLKEGEFFSFWGMSSSREPGKPLYVLQGWDVSGDPVSPGSEWRADDIVLGESGSGATVAGRQALWDHLLQDLPPGTTFSYWGETSKPPVTARFLMPGEELKGNAIDWNEGRRDFSPKMDLTLDVVKETPWKLFGMVAKYRKPLVFDVAAGGSAAKPGGGSIFLYPLATPRFRDFGFMVSLHFYDEDLRQADGPWGDEPKSSGEAEAMQAMLYDETTHHAYGIRRWNWQPSQTLLLGKRTEADFNTGDPTLPGGKERVEILKRSKLYVFLPYDSRNLEAILPAVK